MPTSYILMTALPPTVGHTDLINFAANLTEKVCVVQTSRTSEPFKAERLDALKEHFKNKPGVTFKNLNLEPGECEENDDWVRILQVFGFMKGDYLVVSETWGSEIAEKLEGTFFPYDLEREIRFTKATNIRDNLAETWNWIIPEFQKVLQKKIVIFGAESTGKTTVTKMLRDSTKNSVSVFEYARPYLENNPGELTVKKMEEIHFGQLALQRAVQELKPVPQVLFFDTDLYTTVGYWEHWDNKTVPESIKVHAKELEADLYVLISSNIPFKEDSIRHSDGEREQSDDYWREFLRNNNLPFIEISETDRNKRISEIQKSLKNILVEKIDFTRVDNTKY